MKDDTRTERAVPVSRRSVLKAGAVSAVGVGLFSGTASATDDTAVFEVECVGDEVIVTLTAVDKFRDEPVVAPTELRDLRVVFGRWAVLDGDGNGDIARLAETKPCVDGADPDNPVSTPECQPVGYADLETDNTEVDGDDLIFTFERDDVGLGPGDVTGPTDVALAGTYYNPDRSKDLGSLDGRAVFDPTECSTCLPCESADDLLVKYEWDEEEGEFFVEKGGDDGITLESIELDGDGEPERACFRTTYCDLDAVVKASNEYEVTPVTDSEFCVDGIDRHAISNVRFYCEAPEDLSVGNGGRSDERGKPEDDERGKPEDDERGKPEDVDERGRGRGNDS
ncbi:MAG: hypothetical protein V5A60_12945 [Haloarculaceae archaeon]